MSRNDALRDSFVSIYDEKKQLTLLFTLIVVVMLIFNSNIAVYLQNTSIIHL